MDNKNENKNDESTTKVVTAAATKEEGGQAEESNKNKKESPDHEDEASPGNKRAKREEDDDEGEDEVLKLRITVENRSTMSIDVGNLQVRAVGAPAIGPDTLGFTGAALGGFRRGFGFCYLYENKEVIGIGETIHIEAKPFTDEVFVLVSCQKHALGTGVAIKGGDSMGHTVKKDVKDGDHVVLIEDTFEQGDE